MIDLHTHTNNSDGTWTVERMLKEAEEKNIELLSITEHNTTVLKSKFYYKHNI